MSIIKKPARDFSSLEQSAGFQRRILGDYTITAVYDGIVAINPEAFAGVTDDKRQAALQRQLHPVTGEIDTSVNAFIVDTGSKIVLIDAGSGNKFGPTMGRLESSIRASGYSPEDIDAVLITHLHPDHVGGISDDNGNATYPNATVWVPEADAEFWLDSATTAKIPEMQHWFIDVAQNATAPYIKAGRFQTFENGDDLLNGLVKVIGLPGHTPGHSGFRIESAGETILFWGDITHLPAVQLSHAEATINLDIIPEKAVSSREWALKETSSTGIWIGAAHQAFPGIGRLRQDAEGYTWIGSEYAWLTARG
ncbi:MBL fold metallo-hydrolase [Erwinia sp. DT-104]|jgi:glyoxylase-like metal-dependent hydrolase (beta-lactamase superfamily II)|uniref:MBL fold metallo-hydrolase n=2 Tax=Erwinia TaxID=551 RepID=A0ABV4E3G8_9GAMM|nr:MULTISPECIES: MBL fold metallo-hydrolase [unclassified Erwinia]MDN4625966.1 MBL fold metallo-hydrolase [Erwinia sp. PsM31]MDN8540361.1 MBL fold metallo-hydrolase [Erwinia sp. BC051422]